MKNTKIPSPFCHFIKRFAILDWIAVFISLGIGLFFDKLQLPDDFATSFFSEIDQPTKIITIPYNYLCILTFGIGAFITIIVWVSHQGSINSTLSKCLASYYFSICFTIFIECGLKLIVGRPRPDSLSLCGNDGFSYQKCQKVLDPYSLTDQFSSFPSGHAAEAMSVGVFLSLLLHKIFVSFYQANLSQAQHQPYYIDDKSTDTFDQHHRAFFVPTLVSFATFLPILFSILIGFSRIWDRAHHVDDVIMGLVLGGIIGYMSFSAFNNAINEEQII